MRRATAKATTVIAPLLLNLGRREVPGTSSSFPSLLLVVPISPCTISPARRPRSQVRILPPPPGGSLTGSIYPLFPVSASHRGVVPLPGSSRFDRNQNSPKRPVSRPHKVLAGQQRNTSSGWPRWSPLTVVFVCFLSFCTAHYWVLTTYCRRPSAHDPCSLAFACTYAIDAPPSQPAKWPDSA